jgi:hypothetical protein
MPVVHQHPRLTRLFALTATTALLSLSACAIDLNKLATDLQRPEVAFTHADAWRCDEQVKIPNGAKVDECSRSRSSSPPDPDHSRRFRPRLGAVARGSQDHLRDFSR